MTLWNNRVWLEKQYVELRLPIRKISETSGVSYWTIRDRLIKYGIPIRSYSSAQKIIWGGKDREYKHRDWLYQKYVIEELTMGEVASIAGCLRETIAVHLRKCGIGLRGVSARHLAKTRRTRLSFDKEWLYDEYWIKGKPAFQIAEMAHCSKFTILRNMKRMGIDRRAIGEGMRGKTASPETRARLRAAQSAGICRNPETLKKLHAAQRGKTHVELYGPEVAETMRIENSRRISELWKDDTFKAKVLNRLNQRPTLPEKILSARFPGLNYVGNGAWWRTLPNGKSKNPDFKVPHQNKVVEVYGDYWHRNDDPQELIDLYKQAGLDCLVIWEKEIKQTPEIVSAKIAHFISQ
jgi:G:T-mismatch repair DNA endonuclease (very short patch repair protein)